MSDETEAPEENAEDQAEDQAGGEDDMDMAAAMGDDPGASGMDLDEIEEADELKKAATPEEFAIGEPMAGDVTAIYDIPVQISAVLGRSTMQVSQLLKLGRGAVVELDRKVGEAIDIYVNNRLVARGEVVVVEDKLGVTMTEIVKSERN